MKGCWQSIELYHYIIIHHSFGLFEKRKDYVQKTDNQVACL